MNTIDYINNIIFPASFALLPENMDSPQARAMLLAIGLQESRFQHRRQVRGPARGFWQFESGGGVAGVLRHSASRDHAIRVCKLLPYPATTEAVYPALEHNDVLAAVFARLLLWTDAQALPRETDSAEAAWQYYIRNWRPGKPHRSTWDAFHAQSWQMLRQA
jgi:hypothetical protein